MALWKVHKELIGLVKPTADGLSQQLSHTLHQILSGPLILKPIFILYCFLGKN